MKVDQKEITSAQFSIASDIFTDLLPNLKP